MVGLIVVLFFAWLVSPVFHSLVMALYVSWPFLVVVLAGSVLGAYLWRIGDKDPAKIVVVVAAVAALAYLVVASPTGPEVPGFDRGRRDRADARHDGNKISSIRCGRSFRAKHPR